MEFNYAKEKQKFERHWKIVRQQYIAAGMNREAVEELYDFDWDWFKSQRRYISHLADLPDGVSVEDFPQEGVELSSGDTPLRYGTTCAENVRQFRWIDEIEDERLVQKLIQLSEEDLELLTAVAFERLTQRDVAQIRACSQASVSKHLHKIKKNLK